VIALSCACSLVAGAGGCASDGGPARSAGSPPAPEQARARPAAANFVVVLTDDQDPASLAAMPHVRRDLGHAGVTFANAFASAPECCPSRVSLLTGQYVHNHRVLSNQPPDGGFDAFDDANALPVWLRDAGYRTAYVGKYLNGYGWDALGNDPAYVPPGWSEWAALVNHTEYQMYDFALNENGSVVEYGAGARDYQTDVLGRKARQFLADSVEARRPFFLAVAPLAPHDEGVLEGREVPRNPRPANRHRGRFRDASLPRGPSFNEPDVEDKPRFLRRDERLGRDDIAALEVLHRSRLESLLAVDEMVHRLVRVLREAGELNRTTFIFTSDNGYLLGEHRSVGKEKVYEEAAGVPLVIRGPGFSGGRVERHPVSNVDLVATIVEQSGVRPGLPQDGLSLAGGPAAVAERPPVLIELASGRSFAAIRTQRHVLAEYEDGGAELYDLEEDPHQLENLRRAAAYDSIRQRLSRRLAALRECAGASCRRAAR